MTIKRIGIGCAVLAGFGAAAVPTRAQDAGTVERLERQLEQVRRDTRLRVLQDVPASQRALFDYGAYFTLGYLSLEDAAGDTHVLRQYDLVPYARLNFDGAHDLYLRGRLAYRDFHSGDSFDGDDDDEFEGELEEAYYRFDLRQHLGAYRGKVWDDELVFTGGRQFAEWATGLTLSQYVDGVNLDAEFGSLGLRLLAGITVPDTVDFDTSRPNFDDDTRRAFFGGLASLRLGRHRPFVYALVQRDENGDDVLNVGPIQTRFGYDSWYLGAGSTGSLGDRLIYGAEFVYEGGQALSSPFDADTFEVVEQTEEDIQAWAAQVTLDYVPGDRFRSRLGGGVIFASGDDDRGSTSDTFGGNKSGTDDTAFNAMGLLNTGLAFAPEVSNIVIVRGSASAYPFPDGGVLRELQCGVDLFAYGKLQADAPVDETTRNDVFLGVEPDLFVNWFVVEDVILSVRYGVFFPGEAVPDRDPRQFLYAAITYSF